MRTRVNYVREALVGTSDSKCEPDSKALRHILRKPMEAATSTGMERDQRRASAWLHEVASFVPGAGCAKDLRGVVVALKKPDEKKM